MNLIHFYLLDLKNRPMKGLHNNRNFSYSKDQQKLSYSTQRKSRDTPRIKSAPKYKKYSQDPIIKKHAKNQCAIQKTSKQPSKPSKPLTPQRTRRFPITQQQKILNFFLIYNHTLPQNKLLLSHLEKMQMRMQTQIKITYGKNDKQLINFKQLCQKRAKGLPIIQSTNRNNKKTKKKHIQQHQQQQPQLPTQRISKQQLQLMLRENELHPYFQNKQKKRLFVIEQMMRCWLLYYFDYQRFKKYYYPAKYLQQKKYDDTFRALISIVYTRMQKFVMMYYGGDPHRDKLPYHQAQKVQQALFRYKDTLDKQLIPVFETIIYSIFDLYSLTNYKDRVFPNLEQKLILNLHYKLITKFTSTAYKFTNSDILDPTYKERQLMKRIISSDIQDEKSKNQQKEFIDNRVLQDEDDQQSELCVGKRKQNRKVQDEVHIHQIKAEPQRTIDARSYNNSYQQNHIPLQSTYPYRYSYTPFSQYRLSSLPSSSSLTPPTKIQLLSIINHHIQQHSSTSQFQLSQQVVKDCLQGYLTFNGIIGVKQAMKHLYQKERKSTNSNQKQIRPFFAKIMSKALRFVQYHYIRTLQINNIQQMSYNQMKFITLKKQQKRALALHKGSHNLQLMLAQYYLVHTDQSLSRRQQYQNNSLRYLVYVMQSTLKIIQYRQHLSGIILTQPEQKKQHYPINLAYQFPYTVKNSQMERKVFAMLLPDEISGLQIDMNTFETKEMFNMHQDLLSKCKNKQQLTAVMFNLLIKKYQDEWRRDLQLHEMKFKDAYENNVNKQFCNNEKRYQEITVSNIIDTNKSNIPAIKNQFISHLQSVINQNQSINNNDDIVDKQSQQQQQHQNYNNQTEQQQLSLQNKVIQKVIVDENRYNQFLASISCKVLRWGWPSKRKARQSSNQRKYKHNESAPINQEDKTNVNLLDYNPSLFGLFQLLQHLGTTTTTKTSQYMISLQNVGDEYSRKEPTKRRKLNQYIQTKQQYYDQVVQINSYQLQNYHHPTTPIMSYDSIGQRMSKDYQLL